MDELFAVEIPATIAVDDWPRLAGRAAAAGTAGT